MYLAFRIYNNGEQLICVVFPKEGGDCLLRKSWSLDSIGLEFENRPDRYDMQYGTYKSTSLERVSIEIEIEFDRERIYVSPVNRHGSTLESKKVTYRFDHIGVKDGRESNIERAISERTLKAKRDSKPVSDETWPK